jgi:hypothetical protein
MINLINQCYNKIYNYNNFSYNLQWQNINKPKLTIDVNLANCIHNSNNKALKLYEKLNTKNYVTKFNILETDIDTEVSKREIYKRFIRKNGVGIFILCFGFLAYSHIRKK